jgi:ligand-binding sensor domain-containing protein/serine phosphatase RsbU (regulator of sigma subunit)
MRGTVGYIKAIALFLSLFASTILHAQEESRFYNITADQGLSQGVVNCICQDKLGFMWFGTQDGLNRYDGVSITVFKNNPVDSNSIAANNIICLFPDNNGHLWIGTEGGLSSFNINTGKFTNYYHSNSKKSLTSNYVSSIFQDKDNVLWIGTGLNGLNRFDNKTGEFTRYQPPKADSVTTSDYISSITEDESGTLWIGSFGKGLYSFSKKTAVLQNYLQRTSDGKPLYRYIDKINTLCYRQKTHELLIGTNGYSMETFNLQEKRFTHYYFKRDTLYPNIIKCIAPDKYGNIWIAGGFGSGLFKFNEDAGEFLSYKSTPGSTLSFVNNSCNYICIGTDGIVWVGTNNGVAYYIMAKKNFVNYIDTVNTSANVIMSLAREEAGKIWIGTDGYGLFQFDETTKIYNYDKSLNQAIGNKSVLSLCIDKRDILWIGSWGSGALGYNLISNKIIKLDSLYPALAQTTVTAIGQDHTGKIWIGTYGKGVFVYDEKTKTINPINASKGLSDDRIYCFYEDKEHTMWIGTDGGGVNCYTLNDGKNIIIKKTSGNNTLSSNSVTCVYEDALGNFWVGTGVGLNKYIPSAHKFTHYFEKDGLPNDYVYNILPDKENNLWISTNKGLSRLNPNIPNEGGNAFKNYDKNDGMGENEFNEGACLKAPDGRMFFGGVNGIVTFHPENVIGNTHIPDIYITSCELFGKEYAMDSMALQKKYIELPWDKNTLSFSFVGLDYQLPSKNHYSYLMEGVDIEWSPPSTRHFASYAQLPPGNYVFRVRASNNDGVWNNTGSALYIRIIPPFWKTNWFYATCVIFILLSIIGFVRYRTNRIKKEKKILEVKVEERTHELAQKTMELAEKNRDITSSIEYAKRIQQAMLPPLEEIKRHLPDSFILYLPKDIVSGDFYWFGEKENKLIIAAADCTGHGVPGALMSMIGHNLLNQIVLEQGITTPAIVLNHLNTMVQNALKQGISDIDTSDGMDIALCCLDKSSGEVQFAGANRPLIIIGNGNLTKIDADKKPIGGSQVGLSRDFKNHTHKIQKGDTLYMFSDGYADQFGGEMGKKYMLKRFLDRLQTITTMPMSSQESRLLEDFVSWRGANEQVDDILVIGMHFS